MPKDSWGTDVHLDAVARLLREVFPRPERFTRERLAWAYREHPLGPAAVGRAHDPEGRQIGNYALIPMRLRHGDRSLLLGLGVDLAVSPAARGSGVFRATVEHAYEEGRRLGMDGILGIANAQSAPRMVKAMGWRHLPPLPTRLLVPWGTGSGRSRRLAGSRTTEIAASEDAPEASAAPGDGWHQDWGGDLLSWRLSMPGADYHVHELADCRAVSTTDRVLGVPVAVLLKVLPRPGVTRVNGARLAARLVRHHRTPLVVHWGRHSRLLSHGIRLPRRLQPSPLEVVLHLFDPANAEVDLSLDDFELLDLDAY
jgi:GNAT superfamily N-acetyltransferase